MLQSLLPLPALGQRGNRAVPTFRNVMLFVSQIVVPRRLHKDKADRHRARVRLRLTIVGRVRVGFRKALLRVFAARCGIGLEGNATRARVGYRLLTLAGFLCC